MTSPDHARQFCWEQIDKSKKLFRISHLFAPAQFADRLLALHALFASLDQMTSSFSEEHVLRSKLDWWRYELQPENMAVSSHPVISHLKNSGVADRLSGPALKQLFSSADLIIATKAPSNSAEFRHLCHLIYQPRILLECAACSGSEGLMPDFGGASISGGLLALLCGSLGQSARAFWWIPLNLLAKFGVSRQELEENRDSENAKLVFRELFNVVGLQDFDGETHNSGNAAVLPGHFHILILATLHSRQLGRLARVQPSKFGKELDRWSFGDVFSAWKTSRRYAARD